MKNKIKNLTSFLVLLGILVLFSHQTSASWLQTPLYDPQKTLHEIIEILHSSYITPEKLPQWKHNSISWYLAELNDPHTTYFSPKDAKEFLALLENKINGIWAVIKLNNQKAPEIAKIIPNTPAEQAWLKVWDTIIAVNGKRYDHSQPFDLFIWEIRGDAASSVHLQIERNNKVFLYTIQRSQVQIPIITTKTANNKCYLAINNFDRGTAQEFNSHMQQFKNCKLYIFDLRGNPGGIVDEVLKVLDTFLPEWKPLLTVKTNKNTIIEKSQKSDTHFVLPKTIILIDKNTASAAEIFAWTLKHYFPDQTHLLWETTHGKGSMQEVIKLRNTGLLKYTIALRHIADQTKSPDKIGIIPDIKLIDNPQTPQDEILQMLWFSE